jgi:hypothetical protein
VFIQPAEPSNPAQGDIWVDTDDVIIDTDATFAANSDSKVPSQKAVKTAIVGITLPYGMMYFPSKLYNASNQEIQIFWSAGRFYQDTATNGDYFIISCYCSGAESILTIMGYKSAAGAKFDLYLNGVLDSSSYDLYSGSGLNYNTDITLTQDVTLGWNEIKLVVNGKNVSSSGYVIYVAGVRLR